MEDSLPPDLLQKEGPTKLAYLYQRLNASDSKGAISSPATSPVAPGRDREMEHIGPAEGQGESKRLKSDDSPVNSPRSEAQFAVQLPPPPTTTTTTTAVVPTSMPSTAATAATTPGDRGKRQGSITSMFATASLQSNVAANAAAAAAQQTVADQRRELEDLKRRCSELQDALRSAHERAELAEEESEKERRRYQRELVAQLTAQCKHEYDEARRQLASACLKYGTVKWERHGNAVQETWQQGSVFEELKAQESSLAAEEAVLNQFINDIKVKKRKAPAYDVNVPGLSRIELDEQQDIYNIQLAHVSKRMEDVKKAFETLQIELALHRKEMKRVRDEDESRFKHGRVLNDRYVLIKLVGKGGFSEVFKAYDLIFLKYAAVKLHQTQSHWQDKKKESYVKHAQRELEIQKNVRHPRVVGVYDWFNIDEHAWASVMEYCEGRDLDFHLKLHHHLPEKEAKSIVVQVLRALHYLHSRPKPVIHYDLKPGNILFHNSEVRLTDFGLSKVMEETEVGESQMELTSQGAGTYWYLPPECFVQGADVRISPKVDVWSVGVVFYQILFGKRPFGDQMSQQAIMTKNLINRGSVVEFPPKPAISDGCKAFITAMLTTDARARPTVEDLLVHPYLQKKTSTKGSGLSNNSSKASNSSSAATTTTTTTTTAATFKEPLPPSQQQSRN